MKLYTNNDMNIEKIILNKINKNGFTTAADVVHETGFSRAYINRFFKELRDEGKIILIGKSNRARYIIADKEKLISEKKRILSFRSKIKNENLTEDTILDSIKRNTGIFIGLNENIGSILNYSFTEILNNAIEHSESDNIEIRFIREKDTIRFEVLDHGIGIFNNIMQKRNLKNELEAIQDLLKGKHTTMPEEHSGEGIFFTSKMSDNLTISSSNKKLSFNNIIEDIFIQDIKNFKGTKVIFSINQNADRSIENIFKEYTGESFEFDKTKVAVRLYKMGDLYVSRSQARRIMSGLDKFRIIDLDYKHIKNIGQGFVDEVYRVWKNKYPEKEIISENTNENIDFMIGRAAGGAKNIKQKLSL